MENLWSTWRSQYIESFIKKPEEQEGCIFCRAASESPEDQDSLVIRKSTSTLTIMNLYPYNNGHLMVVPYRHLSRITDLTPEEKAEIMDEIDLAVQALTLIAKPDGFNIGANIGKVSGAGIADHIHYHIVPRWNGDTNFMPVLGQVKVISQDLMHTKVRLLEAYTQLNKK